DPDRWDTTGEQAAAGASDRDVVSVGGTDHLGQLGSDRPLDGAERADMAAAGAERERDEKDRVRGAVGCASDGRHQCSLLLPLVTLLLGVFAPQCRAGLAQDRAGVRPNQVSLLLRCSGGMPCIEPPFSAADRAPSAMPRRMLTSPAAAWSRRATGTAVASRRSATVSRSRAGPRISGGCSIVYGRAGSAA